MSDDPFLAHRGLLFTVAYEMLGSAADAEDVVQETWLRWAAVDRTSVSAPRAYLVRIVTRQALNRLRALSRSREDYVGQWLPEPLLTSPDVAEDIEFAENVSIAMLTVLESLAPLERAVFVLREVFDTPYEEIARAVGRKPAAVRQTARRARGHVTSRRRHTTVDPVQQRAAMDAFLTAVVSGDVRKLLEVLAPEAVLIADGGGLAAAAPRPIRGAHRVAAFLAGAAGRIAGRLSAAPLRLNGGPGVRIDIGGHVVAAVSLTVENGLITQVHAMRNPQKLARIHVESTLTR